MIPDVIFDCYCDFLKKDEECSILKLEDPKNPRINDLMSEMKELIFTMKKEYNTRHHKR